MHNKTKTFFSFLLTASLLQGCENSNTENKENITVSRTESIKAIATPNFDADNAFQHIEKQLSFGFRTPGSIGQKKCAEWMAQELKKYCDTVYIQNAIVNGGDGTKLPCINLIGAINPDAKQRILLLTHWDSRPWADEDDSASTKPILAADDAASGVGVLIEVARLLKIQEIPNDLGVDIFFTDVEDYGKTEWGEDSYCLGTQYWARNPHVTGYTADFGILLDMVGARGASFPIEGRSKQFAPNVIEKVYQAAGRAGYSSYFPYVDGISTVDDHYYVNTIIKIPTIDIINTNNMGFKPHWHTHDDNLSVIDKATLKAVGQTLLQVIYETAEESKNIQ